MNIIKKVAVGGLALALVCAMSISKSLAFLTDSDERTNVFAVGDLDITLTEPNWDYNSSIGKNLLPADTLIKDPVIYSEPTSCDSYMRVYVTIVDDNDGDDQGKVIVDTERLALIYQTIYYDSVFRSSTGKGEIDTTTSYSLEELNGLATDNGVNLNSFTKDINRSEPGKDCYTYNNLFKAGEKANLFTHIIVPTDWDQTEMKKLGKYKVVIYAQAIQAQGFANSTEAFKALDSAANKTT